MIRIKYDQKKLTLCRWIGGIAALCFAISVVLAVVLAYTKMWGMELWVFVGVYMGGGLSIVCFFCAVICAVMGKMYFRRLKAYGYEIPKDRKQYENVLANLPREAGNERKDVFQADSIWGMRLYLAAYVFFMLLDVAYFVKWHSFLENGKSMFVLCAVIYLIWLLLAFIYYRQSNAHKYRDDVEPDQARKPRKHIEDILLAFFFLFFVSLLVNDSAHSMTQYVLHSMVEHDLAQAGEIRKAVLESVLEEQSGERKDFPEMAELEKGIVITSWEKPEGRFQTLLAKKLQIEHFSELSDRFSLAKNKAQILVKWEEGNVSVRLLNPLAVVQKIESRE